MKKLFDKNEVTFAVVMIIVYVVGSSIMMNLSKEVGISNLCEALFNTVMSVIVLIFVFKNGLAEHFGLCAPKLPARTVLFYVPMYLVAVRTVFFGFGTENTAAETALYILLMLNAGFLEEVIFRGFLYKGIGKSNEKRAVIISALTFAIGHIVNLLNGKEFLDTIIQIVFAAAVGFMLVFIFKTTGSIIHCIVFHQLNNIFAGVTAVEHSEKLLGSIAAGELLIFALSIVLIAGYTFYLLKKLPKTEKAE